MGAHIDQEVYLAFQFLMAEVGMEATETLLDELHSDCYGELERRKGRHNVWVKYLLELAVITETPSHVVERIWNRSSDDAVTSALCRIMEGHGTRAVVTYLFKECVTDFWNPHHLMCVRTEKMERLKKVLDCAFENEYRLWVWDLLMPVVAQFVKALHDTEQIKNLRQYVDRKLSIRYGNTTSINVRICKCMDWQIDE